MDRTGLLIDPAILARRSAIPGLIAELSYLDEHAAIEFIRIFGEHKMPITSMFNKLTKTIAEKKKEE